MSASANRDIIEMVTKIMVYKFTHLRHREIEQMLATMLQETQVYQEAKAEGEQIGEQRGREQGRREEALALLFLHLTHKFGTLPTSAVNRIEQLSLEQLQTLSVAWLEFQSLADLDT
jgi:predicted transposase YdaD